MTPSLDCLEMIKNFEALSLNAYKDIKGVWTIGYGITLYPSGERVKDGDVCTKEQAEEWFEWQATNKANHVAALISPYPITQNSFDALVSFAYNVGVNAFAGSTLLKKIRRDPQDETIHDEFMRWVKAGKERVEGLVNRRAAESELYFKK